MIRQRGVGLFSTVEVVERRGVLLEDLRAARWGLHFAAHIVDPDVQRRPPVALT